MTRGSEVRLCPAAIPFLPCPANLTTATATSATPQVKVQVHEKVRNHLSQSHEAPAPIARAHPQPKSELLIPKCRLFAITPILAIIYSSWSASMTRGMAGVNTPVMANTNMRTHCETQTLSSEKLFWQAKNKNMKSCLGSFLSLNF